MPARDPNHFSYLGVRYFDFVYDLRASGLWPLKTIWLGVGGVAYAEKANGRKINPNWMAESTSGRFRTRHGGAAYTKNIRAWPYAEIAAQFGLPT